MTATATQDKTFYNVRVQKRHEPNSALVVHESEEEAQAFIKQLETNSLRYFVSGYILWEVTYKNGDTGKPIKEKKLQAASLFHPDRYGVNN